MQSAPSVTYPVGRSRFYAGLAALVCGIGAAALALWCWQADVLDWHQGLMALLWVGSAGFLALVWWRSPCGTLHWDGQTWWWDAAHTPISGALVLHLDLQRVVLVRLQLQTGPLLWLWLTPRGQAPHWHALRRALCSSVSAQLRTMHRPKG